MLKKAQVHMLPTEKHSQIGLHDRRGLVSAKPEGWDYIQEQVYIEPQHLYFTTDEEIKEPCWIIIKSTSEGEKLLYVECVSDNPKYFNMKGGYSAFRDICRKVVATTNPKLWKTPELDEQGFKNKWNKNIGEVVYEGVSKIGLDFVEAFVKSQGSIKEVMLEYITAPIDDNGNVIATNKPYPYQNLMNSFIIDEKLKLRSNDTVIIHPVVEKTYTLQDISDLLEGDIYSDYLNYLLNHNKNTDKTSKNYLSFKVWFENRYPNL